MVFKKISHTVTRPESREGSGPVSIPVAEELATTPGIPKREVDLSFYSRTQPLESQTIEKTADRAWTWSVFSDEVAEYLNHHINATNQFGNIYGTSATNSNNQITFVLPHFFFNVLYCFLVIRFS